MTNQTWTAVVEEDEHGEAVLTFPDELVEQLGWKAGDTICWQPEGDGWVLTKKEDSDAS